MSVRRNPRSAEANQLRGDGYRPRGSRRHGLDGLAEFTRGQEAAARHSTQISAGTGWLRKCVIPSVNP
jgi:hypothetical protein